MKQIYKYILLGMVVVSLGACDKFLKEEVYDFVGPEGVGNDNAAVNAWVAGVYSKWDHDIFEWDIFPQIIELDADYVSGPDWAMKNLGSGNFQADDAVLKTWNLMYSLINRCNLALEYLPDVTGADEAVRNNAIGEMMFNKALAYFILVRYYGAIPLFDKGIDNGAPMNSPRSSINDVYANITKLLENAIPLMYKNNGGAWQTGHASQGAAAGLLAKVYATMGSGSLPAGEQMIVKTGKAYQYNKTGVDKDGNDVYTQELLAPQPKTFAKQKVEGYDFNPTECYTKASQYAKAVMDGTYGHYELRPFENLWQRADFDNGEHMFWITPMAGDENYGTGVRQWYCGTLDADNWTSTGNWIAYRTHWYNLFSHDDYRIVKGVQHKIKYVDGKGDDKGWTGWYYPNTPEFADSATSFTGIYEDASVKQYIFPDFNAFNAAHTTKYMDVTDPYNKRSDALFSFLRFADVVLVYAEAQCELNGVNNESVDAVNSVRQRSNGMLLMDSEKANKVALRSAIFEERAKEFAFEGDRRNDLIRWGIYKDAMNAISGTNQDGSVSVYDEAGNNKHREDKHLLMPIPVAEINANTEINENNPGWN